MIFNTYEWKDYKPDILMKVLEELKEYFEYYKEREVYTQKYHYYTENVDGYWISFPVIIRRSQSILLSCTYNTLE